MIRLKWPETIFISDIQAVSLSGLNSTRFKDKTNSFSACTGCMTLHSLSYFAGSELHVIYIGSIWALDSNVPINSISSMKGCCQLEYKHHSKLACLAGCLGSFWSLCSIVRLLYLGE